MDDIQLENLELFLRSSKKIDKHKEFILKEDIDSLIVGLSEQETDEPDYTPTIISVTEIIRYYGLVMIGALSGYFPKDLNEEIKNEIIRFLEIGPINEYFSLRKNILIGDGIIAYTIGINNNDINSFYTLIENEEDIDEAQDFFNEFLVLYYGFRKEESIQMFLKIFDFYDSLESKIQIDRMHKTINSHSKIENAISSPEPNPIVGAINFLIFVSELKNLVDRAFFAPVLQSSMWHFYGYYFGEKGSEMINFYSILFDKLLSRFNEIESKNEFFNNLNKYYQEGNTTISEDSIVQIIYVALNEVKGICNEKYGRSLTNAAENILDKYGIYA